MYSPLVDKSFIKYVQDSTVSENHTIYDAVNHMAMLNMNFISRRLDLEYKKTINPIIDLISRSALSSVFIYDSKKINHKFAILDEGDSYYNLKAFIGSLNKNSLTTLTMPLEVADYLTSHFYANNVDKNLKIGAYKYSILGLDLLIALKNTKFKKIKQKERNELVAYMLSHVLDLYSEDRFWGAGRNVVTRLFYESMLKFPKVTFLWFNENLERIFQFDVIAKALISILSINTRFVERTKTSYYTFLSETFIHLLKRTSQEEFNEYVTLGYSANIIEMQSISGEKTIYRHSTVMENTSSLYQLVKSINYTKENINDVIRLLRSAKEKGFFISDVAISKLFLGDYDDFSYQPIINTISNLDDIDPENLKWLAEKTVNLKYNQERKTQMIINVLRTPKKDSILQKLTFIIDNHIIDKVNITDFDYSYFSASNSKFFINFGEDVLKKLFSLFDLNQIAMILFNIKDKDLAEKSEKEIINITHCLEPALCMVMRISHISKLNEENIADAFKSLYKNEISKTICRQIFKTIPTPTNNIINNVKSKKELLFLLNTLDLSPYECLSMDVSDKIKAFCVEAMV